VPLPILLEMPLAVDGLGLALIPGIPGGLGPATLYLQMVQANASQPQGWAISNALRVDFLP
jgi:Na+/H+ antiporter NhaA